MTEPFPATDSEKNACPKAVSYTHLDVYKRQVQFTMQKGEDGKSMSIPYFHSLTTYTVLYPINKEYLESKGNGCKLGAPNKKDCKFGSKELDSILYNGPFIPVSYTHLFA